MKRRFRIALFVVAGLCVLGFAVYRVWFHNPHHDTLQLDAAAAVREHAGPSR